MGKFDDFGDFPGSNVRTSSHVFRELLLFFQARLHNNFFAIALSFVSKVFVLPFHRFIVQTIYTQKLYTSIQSIHDCLLWRVCYCWHMFFFLGFPFGRECYVIALNPDLLYCIFEFFDLFAFTRKARSTRHFCICCNLAQNLLQIAGICTCLN